MTSIENIANAPVINRCNQDHYFILEKCPFCGGCPTGAVPYRTGDCIRCGVLCGELAYGCDVPDPIRIADGILVTNLNR